MNKESFERMEGLTDLKIFSSFEQAIYWMVFDLYNDGFEKEDIEEYLQLKLKEVFNSKRIQNI